MDRKKLCRISAAVISLTVMASGCSNISEDTYIVNETAPTASVSESSAATTTAEITSIETTTVSERELISESSDTQTEETSLSEPEETDTETEAETSEVSETSETSASRSWSETNSSGTMYVISDCVGRESADNNSTIITKFQKGDAVEISALTDSGFYKIKGGGYIHSEYLSDNPVTETSVSETEKVTEKTTAETTAKKIETTTEEQSSEIYIDDDDDDNTTDASSSSTKKYTERYAYKQLSQSEQQLYGDIVEAAETLNTAVSLPDGMTKNDAVKVFMIVFNEEPQYFWLSSRVSVFGGTMTISYKASQSEIEEMQKTVDANAAPVIAKVNGASSTYDKLMIIYDYVVLNNNFSLSSEGYNASIYNAFIKDGELQCAGYAKTVQYFCDLCGIESTVVVGTNANGESHAWNVIYCEDGYYNFDATWGDPINDYDENYIRHTYFLVPDSDIHDISHFDVSCFFMSDGTKIKCFDPPKCTKTAYNYFRQEGLYFSDYESADIALRAEIQKAVENKRNAVQIRVSDEALFNQLTSGSAPAEYQKYAKSISSSVKGISKYTTQTYKTTGIVTFDINYK